jgi:hypothetical protein
MAEDDFDSSILLELYEIVLGYVPDRERPNLAEHVFDWLRGIEAPDWAFEGLAHHDKFLEELCEGRPKFEALRELTDDFDNTDENFDDQADFDDFDSYDDLED